MRIPDDAETRTTKAGARQYRGARCAQGHDGWRYAASNACVACCQARDRKRSKLRSSPAREAVVMRVPEPHAKPVPTSKYVQSDFIPPPSLNRLMAGR
jgi:hypothetical protein